MALVHKQDKVLREIVQQGHGRAARRAPADYPAVVFNAGAVAKLLHHLNVKGGPLGYALGFDEFARLFKKLYPLFTFPPYFLNGPGHFFLGGYIVGGRIYGHMVQVAHGNPGNYVYLADAVNLIAEKFNSYGVIPCVGREHLHRIPPHPEAVALEGYIVPPVAYINQAAQQLVQAAGLPGTQGYDHVGVVYRVAQAVNTRNGGHDNHIPPLKKAGGGAVTQALYLVVYAAVLFDICVRMGQIGLRLVVIVIGYEVFHGIFREKFLEFRT